MNRSFLVIFSLLLLVACGQGQTGNPAADHSPMHPQHQEHTKSMCSQMMGEHASEMMKISQTLNSNLAQMKSTLPLITDMNERSRWQSNIAMWQALADHFNEMAKHAEHMQSMGMGCGMMRETGEHTGHEHGHSSTPAKPQ